MVQDQEGAGTVAGAVAGAGAGTEQLREQEQVGVVLNVRFCHELVERQKL